MKGFDNVASFYDVLATIVFGKQLRKAQLYFLKDIPENSRIFIIGGGTGWLLKAILDKIIVKEVIYIEASQKMLDLTFEKNHQHSQFSKVKLIHGTEKNIVEYTEIDVVITPFILDVFTPEKLPIVIQELASILKNTGSWLLIDFDADHTKSGISYYFVQLMYWFFKITCNIPAKKLEDFENHISKTNWKREDVSYFYFELVKAVKMKKLPLTK